MTTTIRLPYPGLRAFTRDESDLFFGRDGCIDAMVDRLAATRFLAVLGTSGSGKSSLVRTGLLDALNLGLHPWAGSQWAVADLHPGCQPIRNLAAALLTSQTTASPEATSVDLLATFLRRGPRSVVEWATGGNLEAGRNLLILVDQFEELFRYGNYARQEEAEAFAGLLLETAAMDGVNVHVVLTMRSEYLGACALMPGLAERINTGLYLTPRMMREECREAIEGPAAVSGFIVERAFVNRLLNDLATFAPWDAGDGADQAERLARRADQLPLMQHVLNRMWARASQEANGTGVVLRLVDYEALGGLSGALDGHGNEVLSALGENRARTARMVFESLVTGTAVADAVRRPCQLGELVEITGNRDDVVAIVKAFSAPDCNFLRESSPSATTDDAIVDISHESLIRQWTPLRQWLTNEVRNGAAWRRLLSAEERYSHGEGGRLTGLDLVSLATWWEAAAPTSAWATRHGGNYLAVQTFVEYSQRAEEEHAEAERVRARRERKRLQVGIAGLTAALAIVIGFSVLAQIQHQRLESNQRQLQTKNSELETQFRRANDAENQARERLDQATNAKNQALEAQKRAEDMAKVVLEQKSTLTEVTKAVQSNSISDLRRVLRIEGDERVASANEDIGIASSNPTLSVPTRMAAERANVNEVAVARRAYVQDPTPITLDDLGVAIERLYDERVRLRQVREAEAQYEELLIDAERLIAVRPDMASYRSAWIIFISYGDRLKATDRAKAATAYARSIELSSLLSESSTDLYRQLVSYERMGDLEFAEGKVESAARWFRKEIDLARERYMREQTAENLSTLRLAADRMYDAHVKLERQSDGDAVLRELVAGAEQLVAQTPNMDSYRVAWGILIKRGDSVKGRDRVSARHAFERSLEMADLLSYSADDLHRRMVSYERIGDLELAEGKVDAANTWYTKEVQAARAKYTPEATAENLVSLKIGINRLFGTLVKLRRQVDADALHKELVDAAELLVKNAPGAAAYAVGWDIFTDQGDLLRSVNRAAARGAFLRSVEMVELLPDDSSEDIFKRVYSYGRLGELDLAESRHDTAAEWFTKAVAANRKRYRLEPTAANLASLQRSANRLFETHAKLDRQAADDALQQELVDLAEALVKKEANAAAYATAWDILTDQGDRLKATNSVEARQAFWRSAQMAELLPEDNAADLFKRAYSYEGLAALDVADNRNETAAEWFTKAVAASRKRCALELNSANLSSLRRTANRLIGIRTGDNWQSENEALQQELAGVAEALVKRSPEPAAYAVAWDILTDQGDRLAQRDPVGARSARARATELAELLPDDSAPNLYKRVVSYERIGDQDRDEGRIEAASTWYDKEVQAARKRYALDHTAASLTTIRIATARLYTSGSKFMPANSGTLHTVLIEAAEDLLTRSSSEITAHEVILAYNDAADQVWRSGDRDQARQYLARADGLSQKIGTDAPDAAYLRHQSFETIADSYLAQGAASEARAAYLQSGKSLEHYLLAFRTASPPRVAADDGRSVASHFGNLSFTYLRAGSFSKAIEAARHGLDLEPDADWIEANMAHGLLLTGKDEEAVKCYMKVRKGTLNERSILTVTAEDFAILRNLGFEHGLMDTILNQMQQE